MHSEQQKEIQRNVSSFHAVIIGGGLGGLCLAQGLKKAS